MSLAVYNLDLCLTAHGLVPTHKLHGVLLEGDNLIRIAVDVENGNFGTGQRRQAIDGIILTQVLAQFLFTHSIGLLDSFASKSGQPSRLVTG